MKKYINTSNYYLSTITTSIPSSGTAWSFDVSDVTVDWVQLPEKWYFWVDVDFGDATKREIFRIKERNWYTLTYDDRISPYWMKSHSVWAAVWLRDFSQLLNSLSTNTDNFWEVERITWEPLKLKVRWWYVFASWNANVTVEIPDEVLTFEVSSTVYIVLDFSDELWLQVARFKKADEIDPEYNYPIAKIETNTTMIKSDWITDLRSTVVWQGNMRKEIYDPEDKRRELYKMDNMEQSEDWEHMFVDQASITKWNDYETNKQDTLIWEWNGQNIHTINWQNIMWPGNFSLDTILTVGWVSFQTEDWASSFTFTDPERYPLTEDAFIVFTDSGTMLIKDWDAPNDYRYDATTRTITFNNPLYENEHAIVWAMYDNWSWETQIGSWNITLKFWNIEQDPVERQWTFWVNQEPDQTIDLWNSTVSFAQWTIENVSWCMTTNQQSDTTVLLQWNVLATAQEYEDLPETKNTDWNWYFIVS